MKHLFSTSKLCALVLAVSAFVGCKENVDTSARYVFKENTVISYLEKHEAYSTYVDLLKKVPVSRLSESTVGQLLGARGHYTCFAPTNEAIQTYLDTLAVHEPQILSAPSWDAFTDSTKLDSIRKVIVYNSIIDCGDEEAYSVAEFPVEDGAEFPLANLNDKKLSILWHKTHPDSVYINNTCAVSVTERDILAINGLIHQVSTVIAPKDVTAANFFIEYLEKNKEGYRTCFRVIQACGLLDTLSKVRDEVYEEMYQRGDIKDLVGMTSYGFAEGNTGYAPKHRNYGFTIFAETDEYWQSQGIDPNSPTLMEDLTAWILDNNQYSRDDKFVTEPPYDVEENLLYQWITYHILPMRIPADKLVFHLNEYGYSLNNPYNYTIPVMEYYTSMGPRRLFKLFESKESNGVYINRFPKLDNGRRGTNQELYCDEDKVGSRVGKESSMAIMNDIVNAIVYPIDAPISYNDNVRDNLQKHRIRFDGMSLMPEAMNNDIRLKRASDERWKHVYIPKPSVYQYFENMIMNEDMNFVYYNAWNDDWCNLNRDEMKGVGRYEIMFKLPPVPRRGTYEFRYEVLANGNRGVAQVYFGTDPNNLPVAGIPLDLTMRSDNPLTGWANDTEDDDYNAEVDKRMRNNGFMKGSQAINSANGTERGYNDRENVRRIMWRGTMDPSETYWVKLKSVLDSDKKEFFMDYMEYCSKDVYDNPNEPEDIW